jgi:hypothetical protein
MRPGPDADRSLCALLRIKARDVYLCLPTRLHGLEINCRDNIASYLRSENKQRLFRRTASVDQLKMCFLWGRKWIFILWVWFQDVRLCHGLGGWSTGCHGGGPGLIPVQYTWDLWWTKWHWDRVFAEYFGFPLSISPSQCSLHFFVFNITLMRRTSGRRLGIFDTVPPCQTW